MFRCYPSFESVTYMRDSCSEDQESINIFITLYDISLILLRKGTLVFKITIDPTNGPTDGLIDDLIDGLIDDLIDGPINGSIDGLIDY